MKRKDVHQSTLAVYNRHREANQQKRKTKIFTTFYIDIQAQKKITKMDFLSNHT